MKRLGSSTSLGALTSMRPPSDEHSPRNNIYNRDYQSMLDGLDEDECTEETGRVPEKKRRLSVVQVKALERNFEVENKLEPERKVKLAQELGLQPRQVAIWFQNRRARWKTKQLERDYDVLKSNFDSLKHNFESLQYDKDALLQEIEELKSKLNEEKNSECIKEQAIVFEQDDNDSKAIEPITPPESLSLGSEETKPLNLSNVVFSEFKDGHSDSDSSAILNDDNNTTTTTQFIPVKIRSGECRAYNVSPLSLDNGETVSDDDNSPNASNSSTGAIFQQDLLISPNGNSSCLRFNSSSSSPPPSMDCFSFSVLRSDGLVESAQNNSNVYNNPQFVKIEEYDFFSGEEECNFFSEEQAPSLHWSQWN